MRQWMMIAGPFWKLLMIISEEMNGIVFILWWKSPSLIHFWSIKSSINQACTHKSKLVEFCMLYFCFINHSGPHLTELFVKCKCPMPVLFCFYPFLISHSWFLTSFLISHSFEVVNLASPDSFILEVIWVGEPPFFKKNNNTNSQLS